MLLSPAWVMCSSSLLWVRGWFLANGSILPCFLMNTTNRSWNILNWNIRGINSEDKWLALGQKIEESACSILCLQETKREDFDTAYIRKFCPPRLNKFAFLPSIGASSGLLVAWNGSLFDGEVISQNRFSLSLQFTSLQSHQSWILSNIYGPCVHEDKLEFINWFYNIHMPVDTD